MEKEDTILQNVPDWVGREIQKHRAMTLKQREALCRYYGKKEEYFFSNYEELWCKEPRKFESYVVRYVADGLADFEKNDGTPIGIKAILYNRFCHWAVLEPDPEAFKDWYKSGYIEEKE